MTTYVKFKRLDFGLQMLSQGYLGDACYDLYNRHETIVFSGRCRHLDFGFALEIPDGFEGQIRSRSGWTKKGLIIVHGTIDSNYRGEVGACLYNSTNESVTINRGDKIAQIAIRPIPKVIFQESIALSNTIRGDKGFGSSGM